MTAENRERDLPAPRGERRASMRPRPMTAENPRRARGAPGAIPPLQ